MKLFIERVDFTRDYIILHVKSSLEKIAEDCMHTKLPPLKPIYIHYLKWCIEIDEEIAESLKLQKEEYDKIAKVELSDEWTV